MGVASYETLTKDSKLPVASVHSHPSRTNESIYDEICSMGYYEGAVMVGNDHDNLKKGKSLKYDYVYFQRSTRLYNVEYFQPRYILTISDNYKKFYFGTLNYK